MDKHYRELLMGCGSRIEKDLYIGDNKAFSHVTRLDNNPDHKPDVLWDLTIHPLPFEDNTFDEIHAYEVLEHLAVQGDYQFFFSEFSEYWRILKHGGYFLGSCPDRNSEWAWGDPSHKRIIQKENFVFLDQGEYARQVGETRMSDFRYLYKADFKLVYCEIKVKTLQFVLQAVKSY
ncbi:MAG: class I SAM-dependent methyltransferase [Proteobacteria bacterium]|nr:class I SAM-dependent methyltransferase [Pseudomonadota bacterium]